MLKEARNDRVLVRFNKDEKKKLDKVSKENGMLPATFMRFLLTRYTG